MYNDIIKIKELNILKRIILKMEIEKYLTVVLLLSFSCVSKQFTNYKTKHIVNKIKQLLIFISYFYFLKVFSVGSMAGERVIVQIQ